MKHVTSPRLLLASLFTLTACGTAQQNTATPAPTASEPKGLGKLTSPAEVECLAVYPKPVTRFGKVFPVGTVHLGYTQLVTVLDASVHIYGKVTFDGDAPLTDLTRYSIHDSGASAAAGFVAVTESGFDNQDGFRMWSFEYDTINNVLRAGVPVDSDTSLDIVELDTACHAVQYSHQPEAVVTIEREVGDASIPQYAGLEGTPDVLDFTRSLNYKRGL